MSGWRSTEKSGSAGSGPYAALVGELALYHYARHTVESGCLPIQVSIHFLSRNAVSRNSSGCQSFWYFSGMTEGSQVDRQDEITAFGGLRPGVEMVLSVTATARFPPAEPPIT